MKTGGPTKALMPGAATSLLLSRCIALISMLRGLLLLNNYTLPVYLDESRLGDRYT